ncbi:MAG: hypothetical protein U0Q15_10335 [Kineosporiaceae bacterium]
MSFDDLPDGWQDRPMTDPELFDDIVDLVVNDHDRRNGALYLLLCDDQARLLQPCAIDDLPPGVENDPRAIAPFVGALLQHCPDAGLVVVVARPGEASPRETDVRWMRTAEAACAAGKVRLLATAVATPTGVVRLSADRAQACG